MLTDQQIDEALADTIDRRAGQAKIIGTLSLGAGAFMFLMGVSPFVAALAGLGFVASQAQFLKATEKDREKLAGLLTGETSVDALDKIQVEAIARQLPRAPRKITPPLQNNALLQQQPEADPIEPRNPDHGNQGVSDPASNNTPRQHPERAESDRSSDLVSRYPGALPVALPGGVVEVPELCPEDNPGVVSQDRGTVKGYGETILRITDMDGPQAKPRHLALLAISQCGKTTTIGAISYAIKTRYPDAEFHALDAKNSNWPDFYNSVVFPGYGLGFDHRKAIAAIRKIYDELGRRITSQLKGASLQPRIFLILDEYNLTRSDIATRGDKSDLADLDAMVGSLLMQGLEFGVHLIMILHEANCTRIGLTDAARMNLHFLALARAGELSMVDALLDNGMILKSPQRCEQLRREFNRVWIDPTRPSQSPVIVDSRAYTAEALPDYTGQIDLVNHNTPKQNDPNPSRESDPAKVDPWADAFSTVNLGNPKPDNPHLNHASPGKTSGSGGDLAIGEHDLTESTGLTDSEILALYRCGWGVNQIHVRLGIKKGGGRESQRLSRLYQQYQQEPKHGS